MCWEANHTFIQVDALPSEQCTVRSSGANRVVKEMSNRSLDSVSFVEHLDGSLVHCFHFLIGPPADDVLVLTWLPLLHEVDN